MISSKKCAFWIEFKRIKIIISNEASVIIPCFGFGLDLSRKEWQNKIKQNISKDLNEIRSLAG